MCEAPELPSLIFQYTHALALLENHIIVSAYMIHLNSRDAEIGDVFLFLSHSYTLTLPHSLTHSLTHRYMAQDKKTSFETCLIRSFIHLYNLIYCHVVTAK